MSTMGMEDLAAALGGGGGGGGPDLGTATPEQNADGGAQFENSLDALDAAEEALHAFIRIDPDEPDRAEASKALQIVLKLKAANQTSNEAGDMKSLRRALSGGPTLG
jgi:hypothetical protein